MTSDEQMGLNELWPDAYRPDWNRLASPKSEDDFGLASFELLKEAGIVAHLAAGLMPTGGLSRDQAILGALMLKASKMSKAIIAMTSHLGGDRQLALLRELIETLSTLSYLLGDQGSGNRFTQYVDDSLIAEREFLKTITENITKRRSTLPIEESMARSIERTAAAAGVADVNALPGRARVGWPKAEHLLKELGENLYPAYRSGSSVLHTKWLDLLRHHLKRNDDGFFELRFEDVHPRPQPLYAAGLLVVGLTHEYLSKVRPEAMSQFGERLEDLEGRLRRAFDLHGNWLDNLDAADASDDESA